MHRYLHFLATKTSDEQSDQSPLLKAGGGPMAEGRLGARPQDAIPDTCGGQGFRVGAKVVFLLLLLVASSSLFAGTRRYRATWRDDPATSIVIGYEHFSGSTSHVVYDTQDHGRNPAAYRFTGTPSRQVNHAGMRNVFVRIGGLTPGTLYYFLVVDSEGVSRRMIFETPPNSPEQPLSIVAGGDSRNNRAVFRTANTLVSKLKPHFVLFGGDMTNSDTAAEWQEWFDDWQMTTSADGRLTPIVPARGNHEKSNASIHNLFDVPSPDIYYALSFGGGLLRTYTLNTLFPPGGDQLNWLNRDLSRSRSMWKIAQYHHAMRPHTATKPERDELITYWASQFSQYGVDLVVESDAHTVKQTYPIRPSREPGASQGFIRDDRRGTVYIGEGCWGAPLRANNDDKPWTRASGRFNQFKWIWIDLRQIQVRTVRIDRSAGAGPEVAYQARFKSPPGFYYWDADNTGDVLRIPRRGTPGMTPRAGVPRQQAPLSPPRMNSADPPAVLARNPQGQVRVPFRMSGAGAPEVMVIGTNFKLLWQTKLPVRGPGPYTEMLQLPALPRGQRMELIVKEGGKVISKFSLQ